MRPLTSFALGIVLAFLLFMGHAHAIGITPGRMALPFVSGTMYPLSFSVVNNDQKALQVQLVVEGELAPFIVLPLNAFSMPPEEESRVISYELRLPSTFPRAGAFHGRIIALETLRGGVGTGFSVGAVAGVATALSVIVPYAEPTVEAWMSVADGDAPRFSIGVRNLWNERVAVGGRVEIFDPVGGRVATVPLEDAYLDAQQTGELVGSWQPGEQRAFGRYRAVGILSYAGKQLAVEQSFVLGTELLALVDFYYTSFAPGQVVPLTFTVANNQRDSLKDVVADITVLDAQGLVVSSFSSSPGSVDGLAQGKLSAFWDTANLAEGVYTLRVAVAAGDARASSEYVVVVGDESDAEKQGLRSATGGAIVLPFGAQLTKLQAFTLLAGVVIALSSVLFFFFRRRRQLVA